MSGLAPDRFLRILRGLLRPLVRTLIARGVTAPAFYRLLKSIYVEVAENSFRLDDSTPVTDSRISLLTGVHRRDVRAFREVGPDGWESARLRAATFATVISRWRSEGGLPLDRAGFDALVVSISQDVRPRTVLDELLHQELVIQQDETISLTEAARSGPTGEDSQEVFFATNVGDHLAAASGNLLEANPPFLERAVFYSRLTPEAVDAIEAKARRLGQDALEQIDAMSRSAQDAGRADPGNTERYRFGLYFYRERPPSAPPKDD